MAEISLQETDQSLKINHKVPFVSNTQDDTHCYQASLSMIVRFYHPELKPTFRELDIACGRPKDKTSWPFQGLLYLKSIGIDVHIVTPFRYDEFAVEGVEYIRRMYGDEVAEWQDENSDIPTEMKRAVELSKELTLEYRNPTYEDILEALKDNPVMCSINSAVTRGEGGYTGHFVVIKCCNSTGVYIHDPGLPAMSDRFVDRELFEEAWDGFSSAEARFLYLLDFQKNI